MFRTEVFWSARAIALKAALTTFAIFGALLTGAIQINAQAITEGFDDVSTLPAAGWVIDNNSQPLGTTSWFQGTPGAPPNETFPAQSGAANSYIAANFNATGSLGTISLWLLTPNRTFNNGDTITFYTRTVTGSDFPDRLQVRLSTAGASVNTGTSATDVGDFTTLLLDINPTLAVGGYPEAWTQYTITLSGLAGPTSGRIAFRYFVTDGGATGDNSNYIGIDTFNYTPAGGGGGTPTPTPCNTSLPDAPVDYDCNGRTDFSVVRIVGGIANWYNKLNPGNPQPPVQWGLSTDFYIPADYDGDRRDDIAVWRPGATATFYILQSQTSTIRVDNFGQTGDDPSVVADYNADNRDDVAVYREGATPSATSTWYYRPTPTSNFVAVTFGMGGDDPAPGDYDGDNRSDFVVQRAQSGTGVFYMLLTTNVYTFVNFGNGTETVAPGDFDDDGKTDISIVNQSGATYIWSFRRSSNGSTGGDPWGLPGDIITQGDYTGDGQTDYSIWRPSTGTFHVMEVNRNQFSQTWGVPTDYPVA
ncbi:MAG: choice-of-anchor J domain-containing protein, partial [Acidobacteria bacterium]|nr:choice-of-anchor J domain-containing protein [Acidobacteriota bacterium]